MMASSLDKRKAERIAVDTRGVSHMNRPLDRTEWRKHCAGPFRGFPGQCAKVGHAIFPTLNEHRHDRFKPPVFSVAERDHQLPCFAVQRIGRADLGKRCEEGRKVAHCVLREVDRRGGERLPAVPGATIPAPARVAPPRSVRSIRAVANPLRAG